MDKINFQNDITKVNEETFNQFQDNIEKAVVPIGGTTGQILSKKSDADNDVEWIEQSKVTVEDTLTSTSTTNALSANQGKVLNESINNLKTLVNEKKIYSSTEKAIGKWIDGQTIYTRTLEITEGWTPGDKVFIQYEDLVPNVQTIIDYHALLFRADDYREIAPIVYPNWEFYLYDFNPGNCRLFVASNFTGNYAIKKIYLTLYYIKGASSSINEPS